MQPGAPSKMKAIYSFIGKNPNKKFALYILCNDFLYTVSGIKLVQIVEYSAFMYLLNVNHLSCELFVCYPHIYENNVINTIQKAQYKQKLFVYKYKSYF